MYSILQHYWNSRPPLTDAVRRSTIDTSRFSITHRDGHVLIRVVLRACAAPLLLVERKRKGTTVGGPLSGKLCGVYLLARAAVGSLTEKLWRFYYFDCPRLNLPLNSMG